MKCTDCKNGEPKPGKATVSYDKGDTTVVVKDVPALVCPVCGAYYCMSSNQSGHLLINS
jgi:YgiT-type zinc finger domain-containing protein